MTFLFLVLTIYPLPSHPTYCKYGHPACPRHTCARECSSFQPTSFPVSGETVSFRFAFPRRWD
ncbi:hypothetical protein BD626DRAFT_491641 [Schizophyllum amplum]|uniref:Uncharacterized protein n=1 Tax=Schizophyllum amplum TaxID=97359 RepID=A0A550CHW6_9AGAR|nr:hypothetical protein BD626DRAFT_491641 [Auriculariopsis ampla]